MSDVSTKVSVTTLPKGWTYARLPDLTGADGIFIDGDWIESKDQDPYGGVRLIQLADIGDGFFANKSNRFLTHDKAKELRCTLLRKGDVLIARMPEPLGRACVYPGEVKDAITVVDVCIVRGIDGSFDPDWLMHFVNSPSFRQQIHVLQSGSTRKRVSRGNLANLELPIPPRGEQTRIATKIDEIFSNLDIAVEELKDARKKLDQYRYSLISAAIFGRLTAAWRKTNKPYETGPQLLERVLAERRVRWENKQLAKFAEEGKTPKDWQKKYPEPFLPDNSNLPSLPDGWTWASLDMLGEIASGVAKGSKFSSNVLTRQVPYLRVANVQRGYLDLNEVKTITASEKDIEELCLQSGDILFNEGGDRDKLGRGWVWNNEVENCIHQNHVFRLRPYLKELQSEMISHHGNTFGKSWFQLAGKQTTNLASINMRILRAFPVPVPPVDEQEEIISILKEHLDVLEKQEGAVDILLGHTDSQRKNILKMAFAGKLVPQDEMEEPATEMLKRISLGINQKQTKVPSQNSDNKKNSSKKRGDLLNIVSVLMSANRALDTKELFRQAGYAMNSEPESVEMFFLELRDALSKKTIHREREGDIDYFSILEDEN